MSLAAASMSLFLLTTVVGPSIGLDQWLVGAFGALPFALFGWSLDALRRPARLAWPVAAAAMAYAAHSVGSALGGAAASSTAMDLVGVFLLLGIGMLAAGARSGIEGERRAVADLEDAATERSALLELQSVLAETASALVKGEPAEAIELALVRLHSSLDAQSVYFAMCGSGPEGAITAVRSFDGADLASFDRHRLPWDEQIEDRLQHGGQVTRRHGQITELMVPIASPSSSLSGVVGIVTRHRGLSDTEEAMLRTVAELVGAAWESQRNRERLQELLRSKDRFIASVSHELRTPLAVIVGLSAELRDRRCQLEDEEELIGLIAQQSEELGGMVEDLLVSARAEEQQLSVKITDVDLADLVPRTLAAMPRDVISKVTCCETRPPIVRADPMRLRQVIRNLVANAHRHGGPNIWVGVETANGRGVIRVTDDGPGIPEEYREIVFAPYGRAGFDPGRTDSIGLGLTVSRHLARLMGGELVYVAKQSGSTFELTLPLAADQPGNVGLPMAGVCAQPAAAH